MENGIPSVSENITPSTSVTLTSRVSGENEMMQAGNTYMACVYPGTFIPKITIKATADDPNPIVIVGKSTVTITRNEIMDFGTLDNTPVTPPTPEEPEEPEEPEQPEIPATLELTLDFKDWKFEEDKRSSAGRTTDAGDVYTIKNTSYQIVIVNNNQTSDGYYCRNGVGLQVNQNESKDGNFTLRFPAIEGMKLTSVYVVNPNNKYFRIMNSGKGTVAEKTIANGEHTFTISEPVVNSNYYLASKSKNAQISKVVLTYTK